MANEELLHLNVQFNECSQCVMLTVCQTLCGTLQPNSWSSSLKMGSSSENVVKRLVVWNIFRKFAISNKPK